VDSGDSSAALTKGQLINVNSFGFVNDVRLR